MIVARRARAEVSFARQRAALDDLAHTASRFDALEAVSGKLIYALPRPGEPGEGAADKLVLTRPSGLTLSTTADAGPRSGSAAHQPHVLDPQTWGFDRQADFGERKSQLIRTAARIEHIVAR